MKIKGENKNKNHAQNWRSYWWFYTNLSYDWLFQFFNSRILSIWVRYYLVLLMATFVHHCISLNFLVVCCIFHELIIFIYQKIKLFGCYRKTFNMLHRYWITFSVEFVLTSWKKAFVIEATWITFSISNAEANSILCYYLELQRLFVLVCLT